MKEQKSHDFSSFLTLTFDEAHLPKLPSGVPTLNKKYFTDFMKRLRKALEPKRIRFFQCGEYGGLTNRPHHHMILFGEDFRKDREPIGNSRSGFPQYTSATLSEAWGAGLCTISDVSFESAAYVARYNLKKQTGAGSKLFYQGREPEYVTMSRRPGIASQYFNQYTKDIYPDDHVIVGGRESMPPKYFDKLLERTDPQLYEAVKAERQKDLDYYSDPENTDTRLGERERYTDLINKHHKKRDI